MYREPYYYFFSRVGDKSFNKCFKLFGYDASGQINDEGKVTSLTSLKLNFITRLSYGLNHCVSESIL